MRADRGSLVDVTVAGGRVAKDAGLGELLQEHDTRSERYPIQPVLAVVVYALGCYIFWAVGQQLFGDDPIPMDTGLAVGLTFFGLLGVLTWVTAGLLMYAYFRPHARWFGLFADGVVIARQGKEPQLIPWDQVARVTYLPTKVTINGADAGTHHELMFAFLDGGRPHRMKKLPGQVWGTLGPAVVTGFGQVLAGRMLAEIRSGRVCEWSGLELSAAGIRSKNETRTWAELGAPQLVQPQTGGAVIEIVDGRGPAPVWRVPLGLGLGSDLVAGHEVVSTLAGR